MRSSIHTTFIDPQRANYLRQQLARSLLGALVQRVNMVNGRLTIVAPHQRAHSATEAGLQAGDVILQVDSTLIQNGCGSGDCADSRAQKGTQVHLKVQRGAQYAR